ncbi:MAG TPA: hypothetical protein VEU33_48420 [Archangium sp.]|nr:hypothetical protein [Archangium sp.]
MYSKIYGLETTTGIRGTHYNPGANYVYFVRQQPGAMDGVTGRIRVMPFEIVGSGSTIMVVNTQLNLDAGLPDLQWTGTVLKGLNSARIHKYVTAPSGGLTGIDASTLPTLTYSPTNTSFPETGVPGGFYAVQLPSGNHAALRISKPSGMDIRVEWITYKVNTKPEVWPAMGCPEPWDIIVTSDDMTAYVSGNNHIFKIPNMGTPDVPNFYVPDYSAYVVDYGELSEPRQMAFYKGRLYVVDETSLWCIDLAAATQVRVVEGLSQGTGLLIDETTGRAIVSDGTGQLFQVNLAASSTAALEPLPTAISLPGPSGFLSWADSARSALYAALPDPVNRVVRVDLASMLRSPLLDSSTSCPADPWSVEPLSDYRMLLSSNGEIGELDLNIRATGLLLGIGLVPFDYINNPSMSPAPAPSDMGKANTSLVPSYFYQVRNVPFGGNLNLLLNHKLAWESNVRYYRVTLIRPDKTQRIITNTFTDLRFNPVLGRFMEVSSSPTSPTGTPVTDAFLVRDPTNDSKQPWYNPYLGAIIETSAKDNGLCTLQVELFDAGGVMVLGGKHTRLLRIDNNAAGATLYLPRLGGPGVSPAPGIYPEVDCGCIRYGSKDDRVELDFAAWHPDGFAYYSLSVYRGGAYLPALAETGPVDLIPTLRTKPTTTILASPNMKVGHILGNCDVANVSIHLSVPINVIDGYRPVYWLSAGYSLYFTLVPKTVTLSTPWVDPGN